MIKIETIHLHEKEDLDVKALKKLVRSARLFIPNGAMDIMTNPDAFHLNSLDLITLILKDGQPIGWASIISGFSHKDEPENRFSTYPHVGAFVLPEHRGNGYARQALDDLLMFYKENNLKKEYSFKTIGYSVDENIFKPSLKRLRLKSKMVDSLPVSEIKIIIGSD
jgi:GNAT superfamily N-acetyltransferase